MCSVGEGLGGSGGAIEAGRPRRTWPETPWDSFDQNRTILIFEFLEIFRKFSKFSKFLLPTPYPTLLRGEGGCAASVRGLGGSGGAMEAGRRRRTWRGTPQDS